MSGLQVERIALVTDFGGNGPYLGQMMLSLSQLAPRVLAFDLVSDLPPFRPDLAAYLLPALARDIPKGTLYLCVVDPGVGGERAAIAVEADGNWYVGPDNGLLSIVAGRAEALRIVRLDWRPARLSNSFHGRDLFCPIAAMLSRGQVTDSAPLDRCEILGSSWACEQPKVVYCDRYGNLITGVRAAKLSKKAVLRVSGRDIGFARTFCEVEQETAFWYENSLGLVELAANQGRAALMLGLEPGDTVGFPGDLVGTEFFVKIGTPSGAIPQDQ